MKLKNPSILLNCQQPLFPGQTITGKASWMIERNITVRTIQLLILGKCKVKWTKGSGDDEKTYKAKELYVQNYIPLYGEPSGETSITAGNYTVPFTFTLPFNIPPTYQGKYGNVMYSANICLKETGIFSSTKSYTVPFVVSNAATDVEQRPLRLAAETDKYGCCDNEGNFKIDISTDLSVYFPGQPVIINGFAINESPENATMGVNVSLVLNETFYGRRTRSLKSKTKTRKIVEWNGVRSGASRIDFTNQRTFEIPDVQESDMRHCQFIDVCYLLEVSMELPGCCSADLSSTSAITILGRMTNPSTQPAITSAPVEVSISNVDRIGIPPTVPSGIPHPLSDAPPTYFEATKKDSEYFAMPAAQRTIPDASQSRPETQTAYYDWNQSAFTYS